MRVLQIGFRLVFFTVLVPMVGLLGGCANRTSPNGQFVLVAGGEPAAVLVRSQEVLQAVSFFQTEVAKCLKGKRFPEAAAPSEAGRNIVFDVRQMAANLEDTYEITFPDARTMKISCSAVSARFALTHILRTAFGVRWIFQPHEELLGEELNEHPLATDVAVERKSFRQGPMPYWLLREVGWQDIEFKRNAWENKGQRLTHGIMLDVIPVQKYAETGTFPEVYWSVQTPGGKRVAPARSKGPLSDNPYLAIQGYSGEWNPCFSNPEAVRIATADVLERLARNPRQKIVNVEICDNGHMCQCERCLSIVGTNRNSMGFPDYGRTYWPFVSKLAASVREKRPDVLFSTLSYREVNDPPADPLPDNVFVRMCFEQTAMIDPEVAATRRKVLADWSAKCSHIEFYDYNHGTRAYLIPRVYFSFHAQLLREFCERNHACGYYSELSTSIPFEGPKGYVLSRTLADVTIDPQTALAQWCVDAVGTTASRPLVDYWHFWEEYSTGKRVRETSWFRQSRFSIYQMFGQVSQTYGLRRGDMARQRARMTEVVDLASTPLQKKRAAVMMDMHLLAEDATKAVFSEYLEPDGSVPDAEAAAVLLESLPEALAAAERWKSSKYSKHLIRIVDAGLRMGLGAVTPFLGAANVRTLLQRYVADEAIPVDIRGLMRVWCGQGGENLIANGSFEAERPMPACWRGGMAVGRRVQTVARDGKFSFGGRNPMLEYKIKVEPRKTYVVLMDVYADVGSSEGRFNYTLSPYAGGSPRTHLPYSGITLPAGRWQTLTGVYQSGARADGTPDSELYVNIFAKKYEENEHVYVDNVRVYRADF